MITEHDIPKSSKTAEQHSSGDTAVMTNPVAEYVGVTDGKFAVKRSDDTFDHSGWVVKELIAGPMGERAQSVLIAADIIDEKGRPQTITKDVPIDIFQKWQEENPVAAPLPDKTEISAAEAYTRQRLEKLFAPPKILGEQSEVGSLENAETDYSYLFDDELPIAPSASNNLQAIEKKTLRLDEDNLKKASNELRGVIANQDVDTIINKYNNEGLYRSEDLVGLIRRDAGLRYELGVYFIDLLDAGEGGSMPQRISRDDWKTPNHVGYEDLGGKVRSREYVAKLVLSMLDGTFDISSDKKDPIEIKYGDGLGQHRTAARQLLRHLSQKV